MELIEGLRDDCVMNLVPARNWQLIPALPVDIKYTILRTFQWRCQLKDTIWVSLRGRYAKPYLGYDWADCKSST